MKKSLHTFFAAAGFAAISAATFGAPSVYAEAPCVVTDGTINITSSTLCIMNEEVNTINFEGTYEELGTVLDAFERNTNLNYATYAADSIINANITNDLSSQAVVWLAGLTPNIGEAVDLVPTTGHFVVTDINFEMPQGYGVNFDNVVVHLPAGTSTAKALEIYEGIGNSTVQVAINGQAFPVISYDARFDTDVIHVAEDASIAEALEEVINANPTNKIAVASAMNHWTEYEPATKEILIHIIGKNTTEDEALEMVKDLTNVKATVVIDGNKSFTITLNPGQKPTINYADDQDNQDSVPTTPDTGAITSDGNHATKVIVPVASIALGILSLGSFSMAIAKIRRYFRWMK